MLGRYLHPVETLELLHLSLVLCKPTTIFPLFSCSMWTPWTHKARLLLSLQPSTLPSPAVPDLVQLSEPTWRMFEPCNLSTDVIGSGVAINLWRPRTIQHMRIVHGVNRVLVFLAAVMVFEAVSVSPTVLGCSRGCWACLVVERMIWWNTMTIQLSRRCWGTEESEKDDAEAECVVMLGGWSRLEDITPVWRIWVWVPSFAGFLREIYVHARCSAG